MRKPTLWLLGIALGTALVAGCGNGGSVVNADEERVLLDRAFDGVNGLLGVEAGPATRIRCDEAAGRDRYRHEREAEIAVPQAEAARHLEELAERWRSIGLNVKLKSSASTADMAIFAEQGDVRVSAIASTTGGSGALIGIDGSTGCHRQE